MERNNSEFSLESIVEKTSEWLTTGKIDPNILADNFEFISPFWKGNNKAEFLSKFQDPTEYKKVSLSKIVKFDPLLFFKSMNRNYFAIILQYHTKIGHSVYEAVLGKLNNDGLLVELRSIYDLEATKKALQLEE